MSHQSHPSKFKEALDSLSQENHYLKEQLKDQQDMLHIQKAMLGQLID